VPVILLSVGAISDLININGHRLILGKLLGPKEVTAFAIVTSFLMILINLSHYISASFSSSIQQAVARENSLLEVNRLFKQIGRIQFITLVHILGAVFLFGRPLIVFWVGGQFEKVYYLILIVGFCSLIWLCQTSGVEILIGLDLIKARVSIVFFCSVTNFLAGIPMAERYGVLGSVLASGMTFLLCYGLLMNYYYQKIDIDTRSLYASLLKLLPPIGLVVGFFYILNIIVGPSSLLEIFFFCFLYLCTSVGLVTFTVLDFSERRWILNSLGAVARFLSKLAKM
jgi:O-antigen/teichoic acid export membrane protein